MNELWAASPATITVALLPLLAIAGTAWTKAAVVLGILRGGLGASAVLPTPVIWALAALLAGAVMTPLAQQITAAVGQTPADAVAAADALITRGWPVLERFLAEHTDPRYAAELAALYTDSGLDPADPMAPTPLPAPLRLLGFMLTELSTAFTMGVLLLAPFIVIDLVVAYALIALGLPRSNPAIVALPAKLLLFVVVDGWALLTRGFAASYGG